MKRASHAIRRFISLLPTFHHQWKNYTSLSVYRLLHSFRTMWRSMHLEQVIYFFSCVFLVWLAATMIPGWALESLGTLGRTSREPYLVKSHSRLKRNDPRRRMTCETWMSPTKKTVEYLTTNMWSNDWGNSQVATSGRLETIVRGHKKELFWPETVAGWIDFDRTPMCDTFPLVRAFSLVVGLEFLCAFCRALLSTFSMERSQACWSLMPLQWWLTYATLTSTKNIELNVATCALYVEWYGGSLAHHLGFWLLGEEHRCCVLRPVVSHWRNVLSLEVWPRANRSLHHACISTYTRSISNILNAIINPRRIDQTHMRRLAKEWDRRHDNRPWTQSRMYVVNTTGSVTTMYGEVSLRRYWQGHFCFCDPGHFSGNEDAIRLTEQEGVRGNCDGSK